MSYSDTYSEIVDERDGFRAVIVIDQTPEEPYNDGMSPILRLETFGRPEQVGGTSHVVPDEIIYAASELDRETFARYLRIFHGATDVQFWHGDRMSAHWYVSFDTAAWRAEMGLTDEFIAARKAEDPRFSPVDMTEWISYVNGEVYGVVIERRVDRPLTIDDLIDARQAWGIVSPAFDDVVDAATDAVRNSDETEWDEVHAVWGYYGDEYATSTAREELQSHVDAAREGDQHSAFERDILANGR